MYTDQKNTFFAAANTSKGFINYFAQVFDPNKIKDIFIIKGGPGTGKSWMMRRVEETARTKGLTVERFLCSSDPNSLDGIIINEMSIAILDGTAPHSVDPKYPGAVESIIYTGNFWNKKLLFENKDKIIPLVQKKNQNYKRAYQFLKAAGEIAKEIEQISIQALNIEKMNGCIERLQKKLFRESRSADENIRLISAIGSTGEQHLESFENDSDTIYIIEDANFSAYKFLDCLYRKAIGENQKVIKSFSCLLPDRIDAIRFPEYRCTFIIGEKDYEKEKRGKEYHYINMRRFLSSEICKENKQKLRFGLKCINMLIEGATDAFAQAANTHKELERIYISAMDFKTFEKMTEELIISLFAE